MTLSLDLSEAPPAEASARSLESSSEPFGIVIPAIGADGDLFPMEKMAAHRAGQLHLAVSIFIFRGEELLIQQRALDKYHSGGLWANSCCSHPNWGESIASGAARRLHEELGLVAALEQTAVLDYVADVAPDLVEHERVHVFRGEVDARAPLPVLALDPSEVRAVRWARPADLAAQARAEPFRFAAWFRIYLERWSELGLR